MGGETEDMVQDEEFEEPGVTETDDAVLLDLDLEEEPEEEGEEEEGREDSERETGTAEEEEKPEEKEKESPSKDLRAIMEEVKEELKGELDRGKEEPSEGEPKKYSYADLDSAEERLDEMLEEGEISRQVYRQYMRNIRNIRKELDAEEIAARVTKTQRMQTAEQAVTTWAQQNAPEFLDGRTKEYKEAIAWAQDVLGAEQRDSEWVLPKRVAQVAFGILWKGQQQTGNDTKEEQSKTDERRKGYEEALKDKRAREEELRTRESKPPGRRSTSEKNAPATERELEVLERLGLSKEKLATYRKIKEAGPDKAAIQVR